jgi:hypothetical protein
VDDLAMASRVALWLSVSSNGAAGWFMSYCTTILNSIARRYTSGSSGGLHVSGQQL